MRFVGIAVVVAAAVGCHNAPPPTHPRPLTDVPLPASDIAAAKNATAGDAHDAHGKLVVKDPRVTDLDVIRIRATPKGVGGEPEMETTSTTELFNSATADAKSGATEAALTKFRRLVDEFPDSGFAPVAMFDIAAIYDGRGDPDATIAALRDLIKRYPDARESIDGHLYISAVQADHNQFAATVATVDELLARNNLTYGDKLEAGARKGYALLELGRLDDAATALDASIDEWRKAPHIDDPFYIAMATYYKGEISHRRFTAAPVRLPDDQMVADLEAKRVLVVASYDLWKETLGFKQPYWSSAAGYQMSQIFVELWEATVKAPWPTRVEQAQRAKYTDELHVKARENLQKALEGHRMNIELAKAYGVDTPWSRGSEQQVGKIMQILADEARGQYTTP